MEKYIQFVVAVVLTVLAFVLVVGVGAFIYRLLTIL